MNVEPLTFDDFVSLYMTLMGVTERVAHGMIERPIAESCLAAPFAGFGEYVKYPTLVEKVGVLGYRIASKQAAVDGNKRMALLCMETFALVHGYELAVAFDDDEIVDLIVGVGAGRVDESDVISVVRARMSAVLDN